MSSDSKPTAPAVLLLQNRWNLLKAILIGVAVGLACWVLDSLFYSLLFPESTFLQELLHPENREFWLRVCIVVCASVFTTTYIRISWMDQRLKVFLEIVEQAGDTVLLRDRFGRLLYVNETASRRLGYSREELLQMSLMDLDPAVSAEELARVWEMQKKGTPFQGDRLHRAKSGQLIPVEVLSKYLKLGGREYGISVIRDIRERKRMEEDLKQSKNLLQSVVDSTTDAIFLKDLQGRYQLFNRAAEKFVGKSAGEVLAKDDTFIFPPPEAAYVMAHDRMVMESGKVQTYEENVTTKNGEVVTFLATKGPVLDETGKVNGLFGVSRDITERKTMEARLTKSQESLARAQRIARIGSFDWDVQSGKTEYSDEIYQLFGVNTGDQELTNDGFFNFIHPEDRARVREILKEDFRHKRSHVSEHRLIQASGAELWVHCQGEFVFDDDGNIVRLVGTVQDITDIKKSEDKLRETNRLKDLFTDILRHDLMNPASAIKMSLGMLSILESDPTKKELVHILQRNVENMIELCETASRYAKVSGIAGLDFAEYNLSSILGKVIGDLELQLKSKRIQVDYQPVGECFATVNLMIADVFLNLISNAIKYSPEESRIGIHIQPQGEAWVISVSDQGQGIPEKDKDRVFTRFERLDRENVKGTGLGLAIAKQIVGLHGGKIWVEDNSGGGSVFRVLLSKSISTTASVPVAPEGQRSKLVSGLRIVD